MKMKNGFPCSLIGENGQTFSSISELSKKFRVCPKNVSRHLKTEGSYNYNGIRYFINNDNNDNNLEDFSSSNSENDLLNNEEYQEFLETKKVSGIPFTVYNFKCSKHSIGKRYAVALFSDVHIEETVNPQSVLNLNEYDVAIAKDRIEKYFVNLANCINADNVEDLIFASLGDTISSYIHDELMQTNELSPLEAIEVSQNLIYSGLEFLCKNTCLNSIKFIGIVGNHGRTTKKIQHNNGYCMNYEWLMYRNIKKQCELTGLPIDFSLPDSEIAVVDTEDGKRFIFIHGFQIKSSGNGTVCGIYPSLNRLSMKWDKTFKQDKIYLGHFHSCISIPNATVNGSIIGYNPFALHNGFSFEEPAQMYEVYDSEIGLLLTRKIYCK